MVTGTDSKQALFQTQNWRVWDNAKAKQIIFIKEENKTVITPVPCSPDIINYVEVIPGHTILRKNNLGFFFLQMLSVVDIQTLVIRSSFIAAIKEVSQQLSHIRQDMLQAQPEWKNEVKHWEIQGNYKKNPNSFFPKPARGTG